MCGGLVCARGFENTDLLVLKEVIELGKLMPVGGRTYSLERAGEAIAYFGEGHAEGKVVITL